MEGDTDNLPTEEDLEISKYNGQNDLPSCSSSDTGTFIVFYAIILSLVSSVLLINKIMPKNYKSN